MRLTMLSRAFFALLFAAAAGWESGKTCTTDDVRTLAKKDAKLSGTALAECVILDLRGETIAPEMLPRQVVVRTGHGIEDKEDTMIEPTTRMPLLTPAQLGELLGATSSTWTSGATSSPEGCPSATTWASCHLRSSGTDPTASITNRAL